MRQFQVNMIVREAQAILLTHEKRLEKHNVGINDMLLPTANMVQNQNKCWSNESVEDRKFNEKLNFTNQNYTRRGSNPI